MSYPSPYRICNVTSPVLMVLSGIYNQDLQVFSLVEYLLNAAVIASLLAWSSLLDVFLFIITQVPWPRHKVWGVVLG